MTRTTAMDKDRLAAFVDGELSPEESAAVVMHLADHPQDQAHVDDLMAANAALVQAFSGPMDEPVPEGLRRLILGPAPGAGVPQLRRRPPLRPAWRAGLAGAAALAAGLALLVFLPADGVPDLVPGRLAVGGPWHQMLATLPSGTPRTMAGGAEAMILTSVATPAGYCRGIEVIRPDVLRLDVALACTEGAGWSVEVVITEDLADAAAAEGFGTASGDEVQSFTPFLDRIGAGAALSPADEAAAIGSGWAR